MNPGEMKAFVAAFMEAVWNRGETDALDSYLAPCYAVRRDPGDPWDGRIFTREEFAERLITSRKPFPDQRFVIEEMVAEKDAVALSWRWTATHMADLPGLPASGRRIETSGLTLYFFKDGRLCGHRQQTDRLGVYQQLIAVNT